MALNWGKALQRLSQAFAHAKILLPYIREGMKFTMEVFTAILWSFIPGLSSTGSFSRINSVQIMPEHTITFLLS